MAQVHVGVYWVLWFSPDSLAEALLLGPVQLACPLLYMVYGGHVGLKPGG